LLLSAYQKFLTKGIKMSPLKEIMMEMVEVINNQGAQISALTEIVKVQEQSIDKLTGIVNSLGSSTATLTSQIKSLKGEVAQLSQRAHPFPSIGKKDGPFKFPTST
jgi:peptidoglycan hydrolase CwlO-like protein